MRIHRIALIKRNFTDRDRNSVRAYISPYSIRTIIDCSRRIIQILRSRGATESIADINPEDIQSISVLTGAAAAALYGSQAANGAVMITTKKGEAGRLKVTFSSNTEFLDPFRLPEFQNRYGTGLNGRNSGSGIYSWGPKTPLPPNFATRCCA